MTGRTLYVTATNSTVTGSLGLGEFRSSPHARLVGTILLNTGSATFRYRMAVASGQYSVSSTMAINSGGNVIDQLIYSPFLDLSFTAATSSQFSAALLGQVAR